MIVLGFLHVGVERTGGGIIRPNSALKNGQRRQRHYGDNNTGRFGIVTITIENHTAVQGTTRSVRP